MGLRSDGLWVVVVSPSISFTRETSSRGSGSLCGGLLAGQSSSPVRRAHGGRDRAAAVCWLAGYARGFAERIHWLADRRPEG